MKWIDALVPFVVGHRTEITAAGTAVLNVLAVIPAVQPYLATATWWWNAVAPYAVGLFAAARASRVARATGTAPQVLG